MFLLLLQAIRFAQELQVVILLVLISFILVPRSSDGFIFLKGISFLRRSSRHRTLDIHANDRDFPS
jgi:hypothetical protein